MKLMNTAFDNSLMSTLENMENSLKKTSVDRFDIFKGVVSPSGKVERVRSVGSASLREGFNTYVIEIKTLLGIPFYMLPCKDPGDNADFVILTRELSRNSAKKYFWNVVGDAVGMGEENRGLLKLSWDIFGSDIYLNTTAKKSVATAHVTEGVVA